jgi:hypothetical protein
VILVPGHARRVAKYESFRVLENGRIRYYRALRPAKSPGRIGARIVTEVDSITGKPLRTWQEVYDVPERVLEVHPKLPVDLGHLEIDPTTGQVIRRRP